MADEPPPPALRASAVRSVRPDRGLGPPRPADRGRRRQARPREPDVHLPVVPCRHPCSAARERTEAPGSLTPHKGRVEMPSQRSRKSPGGSACRKPFFAGRTQTWRVTRWKFLPLAVQDRPLRRDSGAEVLFLPGDHRGTCAGCGVGGRPCLPFCPCVDLRPRPGVGCLPTIKRPRTAGTAGGMAPNVSSFGASGNLSQRVAFLAQTFRFRCSNREEPT